MKIITAKVALKAFDRARRFDQIAKNSRGRSYRRTGGTHTAMNEWERSDINSEKADEQWAIVQAYLATQAVKEQTK